MAKLIGIERIGEYPVYDITVAEYHNFIANGVVVHNCMQVAQQLAGFSPGESYKFVKTIAKKIPEKMAALKPRFIAGAQPRIDNGECTLEDVETIWGLLETFAGYGFNKSVDIETPVVYSDGKVGIIGDVKPGEGVICRDDGKFFSTEVIANHDHGMLPAFECEFEDGEKVVCSILHKFETPSGKAPLWKLLLVGGEVVHVEIKDLEVQDLSWGLQNETVAGSPQERDRAFCKGESQDMGLRGVWTGNKGHTQLGEASGEMPECNSSCECESCCCEQEGRGKTEGRSCVSEGEEKADRYGSQKCGDGACSCREVRNSVPSEQDIGFQRESVEDGKTCICTGVHKEAEGCCSEGVEGRESRSIPCEHRKNDSGGKQELQSRSVAIGASDSIGVQVVCPDSMWDGTETDRFRKRRFLGRSGWMLALRNRFFGEEISSMENPSERRYAEQRSGAAGNCVGEIGIELLAGIRKRCASSPVASVSSEVAEKSCSGGVSVRKLLHARFVGFRRMCDLEVRHPSHNFVLANGIVTSNSHATCYSAISTVELWLKYNYRPEFLCALINNTDPGKKKHGSDNIMVDYINYARRSGVTVLGPHINESKDGFVLNDDGAIRFSLGHIKFVATKATVIEKFQPIESMEDFYERVKVTTVGKTGRKTSRRPDKRQVESLIAAGAFDHLGTRNEILAEFYRLRNNKKDGEPPERTDDQWVELEKEAIGLCLSREPLYKQYKDLLSENKWTPIHAMGDRKKVQVFGQVLGITPHTSRAGNSMFIVTFGDGLDTMKFFVFTGGMELFRDKVRIGNIGAFPLSKFDDSDTRFFNDRGDIEMVRTK